VNIPVNKAALSASQISELDAAMKGKEGSILLHCATGARAALLLSLSKAKQHHWTTEQAFAEAKRMGFDLKSSPEFSTFVATSIAFRPECRANPLFRPIRLLAPKVSPGRRPSERRSNRIAQPLCHCLETGQHRVDAGCGDSVDQRLR